MKFTPREYQHRIIDHQLQCPRGNTYAGMGLGKTVSTLTTIDALQLAGEGPALVLAPKRVARSTWPLEARKWDHLSSMEVSPIIGDVKQREAALRRDAAVYTINYDNLVWLVKHIGKKKWPFRIVVPDESTRLKGFRLRGGGRRALALAHITPLTRHWINLTGTPAPNGLTDLWGQQWFIDKGAALGRTLGDFRSRWFTYNEYSRQWSPMPSAQIQIETRLKPTTLTIRSEDWFDMEAPIVNKLYVDLPAKVRQQYQRMEKEMYAELEALGEWHAVEALSSASKTNKCSQMANGAVYTEEGQWVPVHDQKLQALDSLVTELAGAPLLVAYLYKTDVTRILKAFPKARVLDDDPETEAAWNRGAIQMLLAHPKSAGHGLNLQDGGHHLAFFGVDWNLEEHDQIIERIGPVRQLQAGYDRNVFLHYIMARDTVDDMKFQRLTTKRSVQDILLDAMKTTRG